MIFDLEYNCQKKRRDVIANYILKGTINNELNQTYPNIPYSKEFVQDLKEGYKKLIVDLSQ